MRQPERIFTEAELRVYDGRQGRRAYVAYQGVVYDVTDSPLWRGGMHRNMHYPGLDLTRSFRKAPHGEWVFKRVPRVGVLAGRDPEQRPRPKVVKVYAVQVTGSFSAWAIPSAQASTCSSSSQ